MHSIETENDAIRFMKTVREMLVDRGPSSVPKNGIPYLSKEGYPYRVFEKAHPELVKAAKKMKTDAAIAAIHDAVGFVPPRKFLAMFKLCLQKDEL